MTIAVFPAIFEMLEDDTLARRPIAFRVYLKLLRRDNIFFEPQAIKIWALAEELKTRKMDVIRALAILRDRGYIIEHARLQDNRRQFTLARIRNGSALNHTPSAA